LEAWVRYIRGHAGLTRELNAELVAQHGLTLNDYEVLLRLSHAEYRAMRRVDLAHDVLLTASGITRLLDGLERSGWVRKKSCDSDARVTYAELTEAGHEKLSEAADFHLEGVRRAFAAHFSDDELETLAHLLARLGGDADGSGCSPPD
jgi:DNA-binding MarR family transcriptional regulator